MYDYQTGSAYPSFMLDFYSHKLIIKFITHDAEGWSDSFDYLWTSSFDHLLPIAGFYIDGVSMKLDGEDIVKLSDTRNTNIVILGNWLDAYIHKIRTKYFSGFMLNGLDSL